MAVLPLPDLDTLNQLLLCDSEHGILTWRPRPLQFFSSANHRTAGNCQAVWNAKYAGKRAGHVNKVTGYRKIKFLTGGFAEHRVIWFMENGYEPEYIDHINGDKADNRLVNLRSVSRTANARNYPMLSSNKSGVVGVAWFPSLQAWRALCVVNGVPKCLKQTRDKDEAIAVRMAWQRENGYHENHGKRLKGERVDA